MIPRRPRRLLAVTAATGLACLAGCSSAVDVTAAPDAADPVCAQVVAALPTTVAGSSSREVTAQGAAAWGDPAVVLRCGVAPPGPTAELQCQHVEAPGTPAVDWVVHDARGGRVRWVTYGRVPAVELSMPADGGVTSAATIDVAAAVALLPQERDCPAG